MFVSWRGPNFFSFETLLVLLLKSVSFIFPDCYKLFSIGKIIFIYRYYSTYGRTFLVNYFSTRPLMLLPPPATQGQIPPGSRVVIVGRGAINFIYRCKYIISFLYLFGVFINSNLIQNFTENPWGTINPLLRWLDPVFLGGYHPTLKLSGIPTFTFIASLTHRIDNI